MTMQVMKQGWMDELCRAAIYANEGKIFQDEGRWQSKGDKVDTALLAMVHKAKRKPKEIQKEAREVGRIAYSSEQKYAAAFYERNGKVHAYVKGAVETLLPMCKKATGSNTLDKDYIEAQEEALAADKYRVIGFACGEVPRRNEYSADDLKNLTFLGVIGFIDPLRDNARQSVEHCRDAGLKAAMITGDQADTAYAIAKELHLCENREDVVTGRQLKEAAEKGEEALKEMTSHARVYARVEPEQKQLIVDALAKQGEYVAVTGDGVNDAPALKRAHVGVAMGKTGTDVARESSDIIITDDNFASIINGIEEGRIAYDNIRKVIFFLVSCGLAEVLLFYLAATFGIMAVPLLAVQLLWVNVVTNGVQHIALALEPGEGDELRRPPRDPEERIFNAVMIQRIVVMGLVGGITAFGVFYYTLEYAGYSLEKARNLTLLYFVLFENANAFNSKSESTSLFRLNPLNNVYLIMGVAAALVLHVIAMYWDWLATILQVQPVGINDWGMLFGLMLLAIVASEMEKMVRRMRNGSEQKRRKA